MQCEICGIIFWAANCWRELGSVSTQPVEMPQPSVGGGEDEHRAAGTLGYYHFPPRWESGAVALSSFADGL